MLTVTGEEGVVAEFERVGLESLWHDRAGAEDVTDRPAQRAFDSPAEDGCTLFNLVSITKVAMSFVYAHSLTHPSKDMEEDQEPDLLNKPEGSRPTQGRGNLERERWRAATKPRTTRRRETAHRSYRVSRGNTCY